MNPSEKRRIFIAEAVALGESERSVAPWLYRMLWRAGLDVPPPLYCSFLQQLAVIGLIGGTFWGSGMWFILWRESPIWITIFSASLFGLWMASWSWYSLRRRRRRLGLCERWSDYPNTKRIEQAAPRNGA
jgi:hypothetical protein